MYDTPRAAARTPWEAGARRMCPRDDPDAGLRRTPCDMRRPDTIFIRTALYEEAVSVLREEYASDLTVAELADRVACSCRQLQRAFHDIGGTSFRSALIEIRMEEAAEMLARGPVSVREAARAVGYRQPAQFAKAFRRHHGVAPSQYRIGRHIGRLRDLREAAERPAVAA